MPNEVDVTSRTPMYRPVSLPLIRQIMQRTGDGAPVSVRELADDIGVHRNTIGNLLLGVQATVPAATAHAIAQRLGVDLLVLFEPVCRSTTPVAARASVTRLPEGVPA